MLKDQKLDEFAQRGVNIAQFVSYGPDGKKRHSRIRGTAPTHRHTTVEQAIQAILDSGAPFVNIRTFLPNQPDGNPFFMGRKEKWASIVEPADIVRAHIARGFHVIVNEDIDINDGGFSGVVMGEVAEFSPQDTPRCVDRKGEPGCALMNRGLMETLVYAVYGKRIGFPYSRNHRIEFSVHPAPVGYLRGPLLMWQEEAIERGTGPSTVKPRWPNRYSIAMGDKAFGLLMAHLSGLRVPFTRVTGRLIPPFEFGEHTNDGNTRWIRTAPRTQQPGKFTTVSFWTDPFALMQHEDPDGSGIAAILEQANVNTERSGWSGAAITQADGTLLVEGKRGRGDGFMVGTAAPGALPVAVTDAVTRVWEQACIDFGPVRFEWVYDRDHTVWVVQLHAGASTSLGDVIYPGERASWVRFDISNGLDTLRDLLRHRDFSHNAGIVLVGNVGITSHFGDLLRRAQIPSRLERPSEAKTA
jgi:hypothetical protein